MSLSVRLETYSLKTVRRVLMAVFFVAVWGLITHGTYAGMGDEPHYMMIAHSLVFDGDLDLANDYGDPQNLVFGGTLQPEAHARPGRDGRLRPVHDIGMPLALSPAFLVSYAIAERLTPLVPAGLLRRAKLNPALVLRHLMSFTMMGLAAMIVAGLFDVFLARSGSRARSFAWALLFGLSPPILSHSFLFFTEIPSALLTLAVFRAVHPRPSLSPAERSLVGAAIGYLVLIHVRNVGLAGGLLLLAAAATPAGATRRRALAALAIGCAAPLILRTFINQRFWGSALTGPQARLEAWPGLEPAAWEVATRLWGWVLDQEHGLLVVAPVYLLLAPGALVLWRRERRTAAAIALLLVGYVIPMALPMVNPHGWRGGWSPAGRFLLPIVPLLAIAVFTAVAATPLRAPVVAGLAAVQVALDLVLWNHPRLLWNAGDGSSEMLEFLGGSSLTKWYPSAERLDLVTLLVTSSLLVSICGLLTMAMARGAEIPGPSRPTDVPPTDA